MAAAGALDELAARASMGRSARNLAALARARRPPLAAELLCNRRH